MNKYHKINTIFKRDMTKPNNPIIIGEWSQPEFEYLSDNEWTFTEKVDGTNIRVMWDGEKITFGGKTDNAHLPAPLATRLNETFLPLTDQFKDTFGDEGNVCLYGEGYGNKIQKIGKLYREDQDFVLFDIKIGEWWLQRTDVEEIAKSLNIDIVPIVLKCSLNEAIEVVSKGFTSKWGNFEAEGVIGIPSVPLQTRGGGRIITKIKTIDFKNIFMKK